jgi:putative ABC transport system ATP-binding protein
MGQQAPPVVEAIGLTKVFGEAETRVEALRGVDLRVEAGEMVAIIGPSGSGKSTLLQLIGGLELPTHGVIRLGGQDLAHLNDDALTLLRRRRVGFVFQAFNLISVLTAEENVALPMVIDGVGEAVAHERARSALAQVGLESRRDHVPAELSGGEQQRVAVARALVTKPLLLLADEPTGNLDTGSGEQIMRLLRGAAGPDGRTVLLVTHDMGLASTADRRVELRDGRIVDHEPEGPAGMRRM